MTTQTRNALGLLVVALVIGAVALILTRSRPAAQPRAAADLVPADAKLMMTADLQRLRASAFGKLLRDDSLGTSPGRARDACDRDALDRAEHVAVWVPVDTPDQFGIAAVGAFAPEQLVACSRTTITSRGGHPSVATEGDYLVVGDDDLGADAARIAVRGDGTLLLGRPATRTRMAAVGAGWYPSARAQGHHARMRAELGPDDVILTAVVDASLRAAARRFADDDGSLLEGVTGLALALNASSSARLRAHIWCERADACEQLRATLESRRRAISASLAMRAAGVAALTDGAIIESQPSQVTVRIEAPASQLVDLIDRVARLGTAPTDPRTVPGAAVPPGAPLRPDEELRPPGSSAAPSVPPR